MHLLARVAEHLALGLVDADDPALGVDLVVADRGLVVEPAEPLLGDPQRVLDLLPLADIGDEPDEADRHIVFVAVELGQYLDRDERAVLAAIFLLVTRRLPGRADLGEDLKAGFPAVVGGDVGDAQGRQLVGWVSDQLFE